jgi:hypothetical protein
MDLVIRFLSFVGSAFIDWKITKWLYAREWHLFRSMGHDRRTARRRSRAIADSRRAAADRRRAVRG